MYLAGFFCFWLLGRRRSSEPWRGISGEDLENLLFYGIFGVILGGRLGYCLFYQPEFYLSHPMQILHVWEGGMSAHGGLLGVIAVMILYGRLHGISFWTISDFVAPLVPLGLMAGRIGNFINGELWGRPADIASMGDDLPSGGRRRAASPLAALRSPRRGASAFHPALVGLLQTEGCRLCVGAFLCRLRRGALCGRMVPRA
jgi:prolipoprotein diacylglyceryl transferase